MGDLPNHVAISLFHYLSLTKSCTIIMEILCDFVLLRIALLWYHTIIRPFFALDGEEEDAGAEAAIKLLDAAQLEYPNSALFLYFR